MVAKIGENDEKLAKNARFRDNMLYMHLFNLKIFLSCLSHFFLSGKYPLDILYSKKLFHSARRLVQFGARLSAQNAESVITLLLRVRPKL